MDTCTSTVALQCTRSYHNIVNWLYSNIKQGFPNGSAVKNLLPMEETQETRVQSLSQEDPLEKEMASHSRILVGKIPWTEEPGGLLSMGLQRFGHN